MKVSSLSAPSQGFNTSRNKTISTLSCLVILTGDALVFDLQVVAELVRLVAGRHVALHYGARARRVAHARRPVVHHIHRVVDAVARTLGAVHVQLVCNGIDPVQQECNGGDHLWCDVGENKVRMGHSERFLLCCSFLSCAVGRGPRGTLT